MKKQLFVTGISTEIGKTVASASLVKKLNADYWKPVQAGELDYTDSHKVMDWTGAKAFPEGYALTAPMSPHAAARIDNVKISLEDFKLPETDNNLLVEGAGGLMVPINDEGDLIIDLIKKLNIPAVLVSQNYLGSINHTILSIEALKAREIPIYGILFNGDENRETQDYIIKYSGVKNLGRLSQVNEVNADTIAKLAQSIEI